MPALPCCTVRPEKIHDTRTSARITDIAAAILSSSILGATDYLTQVATNPTTILWSALLVLCMGFSCAGIGFSLYPILKNHGEGLALSVAGFRLMEGTLQIVSALGLVALLAVGQEFVTSGSPPVSFFQPAGAAIKTVSDWMSNGFYLFPWCIAAFLYSFVFWKTKLVPRWLTGWGILGLVLMLMSSFLVMFNVFPTLSSMLAVLNLPIALQEMVLAIWLIVRGYKFPQKT